MRLIFGVVMASLGCGASPGKARTDANGSGGSPVGGGGGGGGAAGRLFDAGADSSEDSIQDASRPLDPVCVQGGSTTRSFCDLIVEGEGLDRFEGMLVNVRSGNPPFQRLSSGQARVVGGRFAITLPHAQETDVIFKTTTARFDTDGDGACGPADEVFRATAVGLTIADGGQPICPALIRVNNQNTSAFSSATATFCQDSVDLCQPADGGP